METGIRTREGLPLPPTVSPSQNPIRLPGAFVPGWAGERPESLGRVCWGLLGFCLVPLLIPTGPGCGRIDDVWGTGVFPT